MNTKNIPRVALLLTTFLLALPIASAPVLASTTPPNVAVILSNAADLGGSFTANLMLSNAPCIGAYDITVRYNQDVLTAARATLAGTLFDPSTHPIFAVEQDIFNAIGEIRYAITYKGGFVTAPASGSLVSISFIANGASSMTASELPAVISIESATLVGGSNPTTDCLRGITPTVTNAVYSPPANVALRSVMCRAVIPGFNVQAHGLTDGVFCRVINTGSGSVDVAALFSYRGLFLPPNHTISPTMTLAPGQAAELDASITLPPTVASTEILTVAGSANRVITGFSDGSIAYISGGVSVFKIVVNG